MSNLNLSSVSGKAVLAATFSRGAYDSSTPFVPPAGFKPLRVVLENPQSPEFAASAYVNPKTGELVVAYRGSDSTTDLTTALKGAANGTWSGQFTDAAAYMKQAQGIAAKVVDDYSKQEGIADSPKITTLTTGHSLGGMLAQVVAKMYGVEAQVQDAPGAARLIDTPQFKQAAIANGQPESGHDITGKVQNVTTSNIAKLGEQFEETQVVAIPALGQMGGMDTLATIGAFVANPAAGFATGVAFQTKVEHSSEKIEDALHMLAGVKGRIADAGELTLQPMYLDGEGKPVPHLPVSTNESPPKSFQIQALVDKSGQVVAFFDREVVDGEMQPVAVVIESGTRIHLTHAQDGSSPQVIETTASGARRIVSNSELLASLQDARGVQVADANGGLPDISTPANPNTFTNFLDAQGSTLSPAQQTALATQINNLNLGDEGDLSFYSLPNGGALIANADGDIVGEIVHSSSGSLNLKASGIDAEGNTVEVNQHITEQGTVQTQDQYNAAAQAQANASVNLFNSLMSAQQWDQLNDMGKLAVLANMYSAVDTLGGELPGDLGGLASVVSLMQGLDSGNDLLVLRSSFQLGQMALSAYSDYMADLALQMADDLMASTVVDVASSAAMDAAAEAALESAAASNAAGQAVPYLSYVMAMQNFEDHPEQAIGTMAGTYFGTAIGAFFGPAGAVIGGAIGGIIGGMVGGMFGGDDDIPMREGLAHAQWDDSGHTQVVTTQDAEGGGATANSWMIGLVGGLQANLDKVVDANGRPQYGLVPNLLPSVGFKYDPDGFNLANGAKGFMYLQWTDEAGQTQTRYYDGAGNRGDGSGETLAGDFMQHAQGAIAPAWQVQTSLAHWQQDIAQAQPLEAQAASLRAQLSQGLLYDESGQPVFTQEDVSLNAQASSLEAQAQQIRVANPPQLPDSQTGLPIELADGLHQTLQVVSLTLGKALPTEAKPSSKWIDVDGDGYLEQTQWTQSNQAVLAVDLNGDGHISIGETVNVQDDSVGQGQHARTSMAWLDVNGDNRLTAQDPAFAAIKLWVDINSDGKSTATELQSLNQAHITAIDFSTNPPSIERADGSQQALTVQTLTANTLGVAFERTAGGMVETTEQRDGNSSSVLHAVNTKEFDGQAAHTQGGDADEDGSNGAVMQIDTSKLATTTHHTITNSSSQHSTTVGVGDARLKSLGATPAANTSTTASTTASSANNAASSRITFVPTGQTSAQQEIQRVTDGMIENSQSLLFGASANAGLGVLAAVGMGATASAAEAAQRPMVVSEVHSSDANSAAPVVVNPISSNNTFSTPSSAANTDTSTPSVTFKQVDLGVLNVPQVVPNALATNSSSGATPTVNPTQTEAANTTFMQATVIVSAHASTPVATNKAAASIPASAAPNAPTLTYPVVQAETLPGTEDVVLRLSQSVLLANDRTPNASADPSQPTLTITAVSQPLNGQVSLVNGEVLFAPDTNFHGTAGFTYTVTDQYGLSTNGTATLQIAAVNDAPVTQGESKTTAEDTALVFTQAELLANDTDVDVATDGQVLRISRVSGASHGQVSLQSNGDIRFVPDANYHGPAEFTYWVRDGSVAEGAGAEVATTVKLTMTSVNDVPVAVGDVFVVAEDATKVLTAKQLLGNDLDNDMATDADVLTITRVFAPEHCTVTLNPDSTISFTPDTNYHGTVRFSYEITDSQGATSTTFVVAGVNAVNDAPVPHEDSFDSLEDHIVTLNQADLLGNDTDNDMVTDGDVLRVAKVSNATHGEVRLLPNGQIEFVPENNFHGIATFDYVVSDSFGATSLSTVTLNVGAVNDLPVVVNETDTALEDVPYLTTATALLKNDSDVDTVTDEQVLSITQVQNAQHGVVGMDVNGRITFTPDADFHGTASFEYVVSDGTGAGAGELRTGKVMLNVQAVNDAPLTQSESWHSTEDEALIFLAKELLANESDVDVATDGQMLRISRVTCDAAKGQAWVDAQGNVRFMPRPEYHGQAALTYWVSDGIVETSATLSLTIAAVNDIPVAQGESTSTAEDTTLSIDAATLLANDSDVDVSTDGQVLSISALSNATHCTVSLVTQADSTQRITFVPDANFHGTAAFDYTVSDGNGGTTVATAVVNLSAVNDAPVTTGETAAGDEDHALVFTSHDLLANDTDVDMATDSQVLSISRVGLATHGTVTLDEQGQVHFRPDENYHGPAQFTYWVSDGLAANGAGAEAPATVKLTILAVNDLPLVTGETLNNHQEDVPLLFNPATLLANDMDVDTAKDGQVLTITNISNAQHGTVAWATQSDGSQYIVFTPERNYFGVASYQYTVSDGNGGNTVGTVVLNLAAVNDAPDVLADTFSATEDTPKTLTQADLLANDSDVDNPHTALRIVGVSNATHGSVSLNADGSISFNPELDYFGVATFNYTVGDGTGGFSVGTATVNIAPVNDAPVTVGERLTLKEDEVATLSVASLLANDHDVDNPDAQLRIQSVGNASHGSVSLVTTNGITSVVFTPELNYNGATSFTYTVSDGVGGTTTTSVSLDFSPVNDAPVVNSELYMGKRNVSYSLSAAALLANDTDVETPNELALVSVGNAQHGTVNLLNGNVVFVPEAGYSGKGSFDYVVRDADGGQSTATTQIDFSRVNVNPTAVDDSFSGFEDVPFSITQAQLLVNDSDSDNASTSLRVTNLGSASHGQVAFDAQGNVVFTPDANFNGQASFTYQVSDGDGGNTWATASVSVASVNDAPIIEDIWYGRPIYGYKWQANVSINEFGMYLSHSWKLVVVTSESEARALVANSNDFVSVDAPVDVADRSRLNNLMTSTGALLSENFYHNGQQKPIAFDSLDAGATDEYGTVSHSNDPYRQNGGIVAYDPDGDSNTLTFSIGSTPLHGHAWVNQYTSVDAPEQIDHTQASAYWVNQTAAWQYYSTWGETYSGADDFQVSVTDSEGASTSTTVNATHKGSSQEGGGGKKPVTLDLNGDGLQYIGLDDSKAYFDVNDDGWRERMAWVGAGDGLLALDTQGDRSINEWNEISFVGYKTGAQTDLEGLQAFDSSGNGQLDRLDARWHEFGAWIDANANGACETGEFKTLDDLGIVSINLSSDHQVSTPAIGVTEFGKSSFTTVDGKTYAVGDVAFAVDDTQRLPQMTAADMQLAEVVRQAILFNQVVNTASASNQPPLSYVSNELLTQDWVQPELHTLADEHATPGVRTP